MPHERTPAVFLSYASEDAEAARQISEALRNLGIEVWFDRRELRGGDAWDQKIRREIKECSLFVPIISAATQARREGYFRIEWKLAAQRTYAIADGTPLLLPVVIDQTDEANALVPAEFKEVQWMRLPGAPTAEFCRRVRGLVVGESESSNSVAGFSTKEELRAPRTAPVRLPHGERPRRSVGRWAVAGGLAVVAIAVVGIMSFRRSPGEAAAPAAVASPAVTPADAKAGMAEANSIAVLPFTNLSPDPENAFFADGMHEDILTSLALVRDLRVVSRTSVMTYRETKKNMRQIASELGVTHILEGSVRRAGDKVRVTGQLIRAADDAHLWAKSFDRDLKDIFALQSALAGEIAAALQTALSPEAKKLLDRKPTENLAAYDLYLKAREMADGGSVRRAEALYQAAVELDPSFAAAWAGLAAMHAQMYYQGADGSAARRAKAKMAIERAVAIASDAPEVFLGLGLYYYYADWDYARSAEQFEKLRRLSPNDPAGYTRFGNLMRKQGRWAEAIAYNRKAAEIDPGDPRSAAALGTTLLRCRQYEGAMRERQRLATLRPDSVAFQFGGTQFGALYMNFLARGSTREVAEHLAALPPEVANGPTGLDMRRTWATATGNFTEARRLDALLWDGAPSAGDGSDDRTRVERALDAAAVCLALGDLEAARKRVSDFLPGLQARLQLEPENASLWYLVAQVEAVLGHAEPAKTAVNKAIQLRAHDHQGTPLDQKPAMVLAWIGDKDGAIAELERQLQRPSHTNVHELRHGPWFVSLRGDRRFEALLNDPKNNAPLFATSR